MDDNPAQDNDPLLARLDALKGRFGGGPAERAKAQEEMAEILIVVRTRQLEDADRLEALESRIADDSRRLADYRGRFADIRARIADLDLDDETWEP